MRTRLFQTSILLVALSMPIAAFSQREAKVVYLKTSPLTKGYTLVEPNAASNKRYVDLPDPTVSIYSDKPDVFSLTDGIVAATFAVGNSFVILVKKNDSFFVYQNINEALVKKDDAISKGMKIGTLAQAPIDVVYKLGLQIWTGTKEKPTRIEPEDIIGYLADSGKVDK